MNNNGENIFDLDPNRLDTEWKNQPKLFYQAAEKLAEMKAEYEKAKTNKELVMAELDRDIRLQPERFQVDKITESAVEKTITLQRDYKKAVSRLLQAKHDVDLAQVVVDTMDHRKKALENLVSLRLANYYSEPRVRQGTGREEAEAVINPRKKRTRDD